MNIRLNFRSTARVALALCVLVIAGGLAHGQSNGKEKNILETVDFQVSGMTCPGCADKATKVLEGNIAKLATVKIDYESKKGTVAVKGANVDTKGEIRSALGTLGFEVQFAGDAPRPQLLTETDRDNLDIMTVTHGDAIDVREHLADNKFTLVDYYADWCAPCRVLEPKLEQLLVKYDNVALRRVDIVNWYSDMAKRASRDFQLQGIPYVQVFGPDGKLLGFSMGLSIKPIEALLKGAALR